MAIFCTMGHDPQTRNSRPPCYLIIRCKSEGCSAGCGVSCNQRDAWFMTFWREPSSTRRCHTSIHHLLSIQHTPPHAIPAANFHSNPFMQRPLQQLQGAIHPYTTSSAYTIHHLTSQQPNCQTTCQTTQGGAGALPKHSNGSNCKVPYIHTPPHQHTPYTTSRHTSSHFPQQPIHAAAPATAPTTKKTGKCGTWLHACNM